jgi:hypothetical protein
LHTHSVTVDGITFQLAATVDIDHLKHTLVRAITYDPSYVEFETVARHLVSVLITARTKIFFESSDQNVPPTSPTTTTLSPQMMPSTMLATTPSE